MDFKNLNADKNMILTKHFTAGRQGAKVNKIIIHYNAGDLTIEGCYSVWQNRAASAHYQVESSGRIGQLVWDRDVAWHAGNWNANLTSIGVEHANRPDGTITEACLDNGAHLVAALCIGFNLGRPQWLVNVFPHKYFSATACPGQIYGSQKDAYIKRAQYWYDQMTGSKPAPTPQPSPQPAPTPTTGYLVKITTPVLNIRKGAGTNFATAGSVKKGEVYTIVAESAGQGASKWGKLKSGAGWISLDYVQKTSAGSAPSAPAKKDNTTIAREVIAGAWGKGADRKNRLQAAGYDYNAVQAEVNRLMGVGGSAPARKSVDAIAREIIKGTCSDPRWNNWGTGSTRVSRLRAAGYDPNAVQNRVNQLL